MSRALAPLAAELLAISGRIVERHGGRLALVSDSRSGAIFEMRLPLTPP